MPTQQPVLLYKRQEWVEPFQQQLLNHWLPKVLHSSRQSSLKHHCRATLKGIALNELLTCKPELFG